MSDPILVGGIVLLALTQALFSWSLYSSRRETDRLLAKGEELQREIAELKREGRL